MATTRDVFMGLEARARVGWAKWFQATRENQEMQVLVEVLTDRIETLIPYTMALTDAVLYERNIEAFARAWKLHQLILRYMEGARV